MASVYREVGHPLVRVSRITFGLLEKLKISDISKAINRTRRASGTGPAPHMR